MKKSFNCMKVSKYVSDRTRTTSTQLYMREEEYILYILFGVFNAHYLAWIKSSSPAIYHNSFLDRFDALQQSISLAFSNVSMKRMEYVVKLSRRLCFKFKRQLIIEIAKSSSTTKSQLTLSLSKFNAPKSKTRPRHIIGVVFREIDESYGQIDPNSVHFFDFESDSSCSIDVLPKFNNSDLKMQIDLHYLLETSDSESKKQTKLSASTRILTLKEYEISGYSGFSERIEINEGGEEKIFRLNFHWELDREKMFETIQYPEIVSKYFSGSVLALGTYFFRFYSTLYGELLRKNITKNEAIRSFSEVSFVIGSTQRLQLTPYIIDVCNQIDSQTNIQCDQEMCPIWFHLVHAIILLLDQDQTDSIEIFMKKLQTEPFNHIVRFGCREKILQANNEIAKHLKKTNQLFVKDQGQHHHLHQMLIKKMQKFLKQNDPIIHRDCFQTLLLNLLLDTTRKELYSLQKSSILLFTNFFELTKMSSSSFSLDAFSSILPSSSSSSSVLTSMSSSSAFPSSMSISYSTSSVISTAASSAIESENFSGNNDERKEILDLSTMIKKLSIKASVDNNGGDDDDEHNEQAKNYPKHSARSNDGDDSNVVTNRIENGRMTNQNNLQSKKMPLKVLLIKQLMIDSFPGQEFDFDNEPKLIYLLRQLVKAFTQNNILRKILNNQISS
ncbi:hypothetical protein NH340_JMT05132 [Sarcoptes scabiei]|nr:hypothetical protein NH340_JMT05132 [Sarcoptes scabiei]